MKKFPRSYFSGDSGNYERSLSHIERQRSIASEAWLEAEKQKPEISKDLVEYMKEHLRKQIFSNARHILDRNIGREYKNIRTHNHDVLQSFLSQLDKLTI